MKSDAFDLIDNAGWPVLVVETGGTIRRANQTAHEVFGAKLDGEGPSLAALWPEGCESAEQFLSRWERSTNARNLLRFCVRGGAIKDFVTFISLQTQEGQRRFLFQMFPREGEGAAPAAAQPAPGPAAEGTLIQKQRLDCALQLARTVALDMNNALTTILGHTTLVLSKMELSHPFRTSLLEVEKAAERAAAIAQHLSSFSRSEKEVPSLAPANLNQVLQRTVEPMRQAKNIHFVLQLAPDLHPARFDEGKIQQVFTKILDNASETVGDYGNIRLITRNLELAQPLEDGTARLQPGAYVCGEVIDDGPGIDPEVLPRVFEPFFTTKPGHRGLGLALAYGVVTNHGGSITLSSLPNKGASVRVYLPAVKTQPKGGGGKTPVWGGGQCILLVDDEEMVLTMGRVVLNSAGYRVVTANSGQKALEILSGGKPVVDLVVTDLVMPQMGGRDLIERIRALSPALPVVRMSGYPRSAETPEAGYLQKPFGSQELLRQVKLTLDGGQAV